MTNLLTGAVSASEAQAMLDHASRQSDRWLFLACLIVLLFCLAGAAVYQTKWVRALVDELRQDRRDLGEIIKNNTVLFGRVEKRLDQ